VLRVCQAFRSIGLNATSQAVCDESVAESVYVKRREDRGTDDSTGCNSTVWRMCGHEAAEREWFS
jgi:hypothetical protein